MSLRDKRYIIGDEIEVMPPGGDCDDCDPNVGLLVRQWYRCEIVPCAEKMDGRVCG